MEEKKRISIIEYLLDSSILNPYSSIYEEHTHDKHKKRPINEIKVNRMCEEPLPEGRGF